MRYFEAPTAIRWENTVSGSFESKREDIPQLRTVSRGSAQSKHGGGMRYAHPYGQRYHITPL